MPKHAGGKGETPKPTQRPDPAPPALPVPELRHDRWPPVADEEIINRLNELLEAERAGVEVASVLQQADQMGVTDNKPKKFAEDEASACTGLYRGILGYGGSPRTRQGILVGSLLP